MRKHRQPWTKKQQLIFGMIVLVVTVILSITAMLVVAVKPYVDAEKQVIAIAKTKADIHTVSEFNIYNGKATYYGLLGQSSKGEKLAKDIAYVHLGKYGKTPIWEVKSGTRYYLVDFISGQVIKVEGL